MKLYFRLIFLNLFFIIITANFSSIIQSKEDQIKKNISRVNQKPQLFRDEKKFSEKYNQVKDIYKHPKKATNFPQIITIYYLQKNSLKSHDEINDSMKKDSNS